MVTCTPMKIDRNNYEGVIALFEIVNVDKGEPGDLALFLIVEANTSSAIFPEFD